MVIVVWKSKKYFAEQTRLFMPMISMVMKISRDVMHVLGRNSPIQENMKKVTHLGISKLDHLLVRMLHGMKQIPIQPTIIGLDLIIKVRTNQIQVTTITRMKQ